MRKQRELTGRMVLIYLIGFFATVFAVNAWMVKAATSTFGGVEVASSYKAGLQFGQDVADARRQAALGWRVDGKVNRAGNGETTLDLSVRDRNGAPLAGLVAEARFAHPADSRLDHVVTLREATAGTFRGVADVSPGQWELVIDLSRGEEEVFRSKSRVILR